MKEIILDSDGLIKLTKAGVLKELSSGYRLVITEQVYEEVVTKGKTHGHMDASNIEKMVKEGVVRVEAVPGKRDVRLGEGELSCSRLYSRKGSFIVSDDQAFLRYLEFREVPFVIPTDLIAAAACKGMISAEKAEESLIKIRDMVRKENLEKAMGKLEERE